MLLYYIIATLSVFLYLHGFFPVPPRPIEKSTSNDIHPNHSTPAKVVIIVIDALRLDFITDSKTPFLAKTFKENGCFIQLKVETPTVTLPRIKALTTGNVPQFVDIILNLASPTKVEDSFIHEAHAAGKKIVFYGDDLWVKLFPEQFLRSEGTSSFFVNDYTEVDDNVTRNVELEVQRNDWDIMVLHYLGLDHIGHVYGPKSPLILKKLKEMDSVIKKLYDKTENTFFMITGDHGMRDSGGHGGSTYPETNVPLVILGLPACTNATFAQIDIPANLAILLNFNIPTTSIGQLQKSLLSHLPHIDFLKSLKYNSFLLRNKLDLCGDSIHTADHFFELFLLNNDSILAQNAAKIYEDCAKKVSETLLKTSIRQNITSLVIATITAITVLLKIAQNLFGVSQKNYRFEQTIMLAILALQLVLLHPLVGVFLVAITLFLALRNLVTFDLKQIRRVDLSFLTFISILHPWSFLSSSFLEEEHQFWYFFTNTFILLNFLKDLKQARYWLSLFTVIRFARTINQVGDKWAAVPDLADFLLQNENVVFLHLIFILGLILTFFCTNLFAKNKISNFITALVLSLIYIFRFVANVHTVLGQVLWLLIFLRFLSTKGFLPVWILIISLLLKPYNVILIPVCVLTSRLFHKCLKNETLIMAHWWLGNLLFFAQGHDNSLASVDISTGYVGLREYNPLLVFPQVLCHTYALPVLSHLLLFTNRSVSIYKSLSIFIFFRLYVVVLVFVVTFIHRHHLFIWSVFAPKMFVESSHFAFLFIEVCCYYCKTIINKVCF